METINYVGEHLMLGKLGHFSVILGFVTSLLAVVAYSFGTQAQMKNDISEKGWNRIGRISFILHALMIFTIVGTLFYLMVNRYYEFSYVYQHTSDDLPMRYIFSAFWEGQEGSFLLWMFWHAVLGLVLVFTAKKWEAPVLAVLALVQVFLFTMILGIYFGPEEARIGSNPFALLRDLNDAPIFSRPDYLNLINGNGLNALLQNYWMTIHPPTLFLGFASTVVPFCFAIAGLWTGKHREWLRPMLPWAMFSAAVLGTGILMGGAWAYEALSFGGYWAWDPVENASLVPWIVLVGAIHTGLVAKSTGYSLRATYLFSLLVFILIVYSTFLTRSGILGDTSVHAFTEMGLEVQLTAFLGTFTIGGLLLFFIKRRSIPTSEKEEATYSREFWMFIGALVLIFSATIITISTSLPVFNKIIQIFNPEFDGWAIKKDEVIEHYNKYQLWIAVLVSVLSGVTQFLRYKGVNAKNHLPKVAVRLGVFAVIAIVLTFLVSKIVNINAWQYIVLMWASLFTVIANTDYIVSVLKGNIKISASAIGHIGFGIMLVGIMYSGLNKNIISRSFLSLENMEGFDSEEAGNNILIAKGLPTPMDDYLVTYIDDSSSVFNRYFDVNYKKVNKETGELEEEFTLHPSIIYSKDFRKVEVANPDTKHYWYKDIYTHITGLPISEQDVEAAKAREDSLVYDVYKIGVGDTAYTKGAYVIFDGFNDNPQNLNYKPQTGDIAKGAKFTIKRMTVDSTWSAEPVYLTRDNQSFAIHDEVEDVQMKFRFPDDFVETDADLNYQTFEKKKGDKFTMDGYEFSFDGFQKEITNPTYKAKSGDIAVSAILNIKKIGTNTVTNLQPVYLIRGQDQFNIADESRDLGLKVRFLKVDPNTESVTLMVATNLPKKESVTIEIAENLDRKYLVMQAIEFPGINFVWLGCMMIMFGFLMAMVSWMKKPR